MILCFNGSTRVVKVFSQTSFLKFGSLGERLTRSEISRRSDVVVGGPVISRLRGPDGRGPRAIYGRLPSSMLTVCRFTHGFHGILLSRAAGELVKGRTDAIVDGRESRSARSPAFD